MKKFPAVILVIILLVFAFLMGARFAAPESGVPAETGAPAVPSPTLTPTPTPAPTPAPPATAEKAIAQAIRAFAPTLRLELAPYGLEGADANAIRNLYYNVLSAYPELKYAYDIAADCADGYAELSFSYMPYRTGAYVKEQPPGSHLVPDLRAAAVMANSMAGAMDKMSIAITDPELDVDDISKALLQAGYGIYVCTLNSDATEIRSVVTPGISAEEAERLLSESFAMAKDIVDRVVTPDMSEEEKARALYTYLTENVTYDFRYYNDRENMPQTSQLAYGAFKDGTAICGGYALAYKTLLDIAQVECWTVSGDAFGEGHMWNYVKIDGEYYHCDPTADRGSTSFRYFMQPADSQDFVHSHEWDQEFLLRLTDKS
ncbi:MAG: transglutaminase domain-containing protein [Candidatus Heteroscillospira sp.]|jgi:hypothetical protein